MMNVSPRVSNPTDNFLALLNDEELMRDLWAAGPEDEEDEDADEDEEDEDDYYEDEEEMHWSDLCANDELGWDENGYRDDYP